MIYTPVIWVQLLAAFLLGGAALFIQRGFRGAPAASAFTATMAAGAAWVVIYTLAISTVDPPLRIFFGNLNVCAAVIAATLPLGLALQYTGRGRLLTRRNMALLAVAPVLIGVMALTSPWHDFFRTEYRVDTSGNLSGLLFTIRAGYAAYLAYMVAVNAIACGLLIRFARDRSERLGDTLRIVGGIAIPLVSGILFSLGVTPIRGYDFSPASLALSGLLFLWALGRGRWLDVIPIAHSTMVEHIDDVVIVTNERGEIVYGNPAACAATGAALVPSGSRDPARLPPEWAVLLSGAPGDPDRKTEHALPVRGETRMFDLAETAVRDSRGRCIGRLFLFHDFTRRKNAERDLAESERMFRLMSENTASGLYLSRGDRFIRVNPALCALLGYSESELLTVSPVEMAHPDEREMVRARYQARLRGELAPNRYELRVVGKDGRERWVDLSAAALTIGGEPATLGTVFDITDRRRLEDALRLSNEVLAARLEEIQALQDRLREQAVRDVLTGLFNRRYLQETLDRELAAAARTGSMVGVMMMDLDDFKALNDTHGHAAGDRMLEEMGRLLRAQTRQMDIVCRYGGEEFVVVMPTATLDTTSQRAWQLCRAVMGLRVPFEGVELRTTISVGVVAFPAQGSDEDSLLRAADDALYRAKRAGKNCVVVFPAA